MTPFVVYLAAVIVGLLIGVVMLEIGDVREHDRRDAEDYAEFEAWQRARDVTGRLR